MIDFVIINDIKKGKKLKIINFILIFEKPEKQSNVY